MKNKVPSTIIGRGSRSRYMGIERELLAKRQMLEQEAHKKYDELDIIHQRIMETNAEIEKARENQKREPAILLRSDPTLVDRMREKEREE